MQVPINVRTSSHSPHICIFSYLLNSSLRLSASSHKVAFCNQTWRRILHQCVCHALLSSDFDIKIDLEISNYIVCIPLQADVLIFPDGAFWHDTKMIEDGPFSFGIQSRSDISLSIWLVSDCWRYLACLSRWEVAYIDLMNFPFSY